MYLRPSEIFFSQDSINNVFDKNCGHRYQPIGETLDALCDGRCSVSSIPTISVVKHNNKWFTADNRRLWVFRSLERLGKCDKIFVREGSYIPSSKFTTYNGGESVIVRNGSPGGIWHRRPSVKKPRPTPTIAINKIPVSVNDSNKENVAKICTIDDNTIDSPDRRPFQEVGNFVPSYSVMNENTSTHPESESDTDSLSTSSSLGQSKDSHNYENRGYLTSSLNSDKSSPQETQTDQGVSSTVNVSDETTIELDIPPCQNAVDEDNNLTVVVNPKTALIVTNKKCRIRCIIITAIVVILLLVSILFLAI
ncbi:uncharacterized protein LOC128553276 [Mercenaria mercenaria]|uniref:uncharacterized protein LOC128553276 n=1 Tax=Mercenaria mercenaria TaxID=6596 RepID=UPI00234FB3B1|nr:uncharacterized protein LOC128553276 [Mercenaria mercenaria]